MQNLQVGRGAGCRFDGHGVYQMMPGQLQPQLRNVSPTCPQNPCSAPGLMDCTRFWKLKGSFMDCTPVALQLSPTAAQAWVHEADGADTRYTAGMPPEEAISCLDVRLREWIAWQRVF